LGKVGESDGNKIGKGGRRRKAQDFPSNPAARLATLSRESSMEGSGRLEVCRPSDSGRPASLTGGDDWDEDDC
jgi:hypothetical protein